MLELSSLLVWFDVCFPFGKRQSTKSHETVRTKLFQFHVISWTVLSAKSQSLRLRGPLDRSRPWVGGGLVFTVFLLTACCSQLTVKGQTPEPVDTIRVDTDLVNLNVSIVTRKAASAPGHLEQKDFAVFDNGSPQQISFFASVDAPIDLVLLLDLSGSTADKIGLIRKSAKRFVDAGRPNDRIAIVTFTSDIQVVSKLTSDHKALKKSIDDIQKSFDGTNFWDALRFVMEHLVGQSRAENRRSAVVVMTDGVDNALPGVFGDGSQTSFADLLQIVQHSDSIVLPIYLDTENEKHEMSTLKDAYALARQQLAMLADESGNVIYRARKVKDLEGVYQQVMRDLGTVYSIGYRPENLVREGSWRAVTVELIGHSELAVRARRGYYTK
jgi:Ca-activated chloride channel family protein